MANLIQKAGETSLAEKRSEARAKWESSMLRTLAEQKKLISSVAPAELADRAGADLRGEKLFLDFWSRPVTVELKQLTVTSADGEPCSLFDTAMITYYLAQSDGWPCQDHWIGFRDLPNGVFYNQAFQGYSGDLLANACGNNPANFDRAAKLMHADPIPAIAPHAWAFQAFPRLRLAAVLWPGDEDFPARAAILFDAACAHYMVTDGLALLGAGLARRLLRHIS